MKIPVIAASLVKFGELWDKSLDDLIKDSGKKALYDGRIKPDQIDELYIANAFASKTSGQSLLGPIAFEELKIGKSICVAAGDASGAIAIQKAADSISSGKNKIVMIIGAEKISDLKSNDILSINSQLIGQEEALMGATIQSQFAIMARRYLYDFKLNARDLSFIPSLNHRNSLGNEFAQYRFELPEDRIDSSPVHSDPIRMLECASYCDGAAALIMCSEKEANKFKKKYGYMLAGSCSTDSLSLSKRKSLIEIESTIKSSNEAFKSSSLRPNDIGLLEVHDVVPISEILAVEDMGFAKKGEGLDFIKLNSKKINSTGGLKACGHAVGATGVRQAVDILNKLKSSNLRYGLAHSLAGTGGISAVNIFGAK